MILVGTYTYHWFVWSNFNLLHNSRWFTLPIQLFQVLFSFCARQQCLRGVMVKAMDCRVVVSEFELQSRSYVHFRTNTLGKSMNPLIPPVMVGWVLWHIKLCRLFNAKSIFMQIVLFQPVQFSMSTQFNYQRNFYFKLSV